MPKGRVTEDVNVMRQFFYLDEGAKAFIESNGHAKDDCPYDDDTFESQQWLGGFEHARMERVHINECKYHLKFGHLYYQCDKYYWYLA